MIPEAPEELSSWKEIAAYLGVSVRTAQQWEQQRGLPVTRLPGGRGRVAISVAALEAWKHSRPIESVRGNSTLDLARGTFWHLLWRPGWKSAVALAAGVFAWAIWAVAPFSRGNPERVSITGNGAVAVDRSGRTLWQLPSNTRSEERDFWVGDLDNDGRNEVLSRRGRVGREMGDELASYGSDGRELWRFAPERCLRTESETFDPPYSVVSFMVVELSGRQHVVASTEHTLYYPAQIALLDGGGRLIREYWHAGHLRQIAAFVSGGSVVLLAGGVNNARKEATVVVLDPHRMEGAGVERSPKYQFQQMAPARERARLYFPRACMNQRLDPFNHVVSLLARKDHFIVVVDERTGNAGATVYYHMNPDLTLRSMSLGTSFEMEHKRLHAAGVLDHELGERDLIALRQIVVERN